MTCCIFLPTELLACIFQFQHTWRFNHSNNRIYHRLSCKQIETFHQLYKKISKPITLYKEKFGIISQVNFGRYVLDDTFHHVGLSFGVIFGFCYFSDSSCFRFHYKNCTYYY